MTAVSRVAVVVPSVGASPWLEACLEALGATAAAAPGVEVVSILVWQGPAPPPAAAAMVDRVVTLDRPVGFSRAANRGLAEAAATGAPLVALVNDDALVEPGWLGALVAALEADPDLAAVQGVTLLGIGDGDEDGDEPYDPPRVDAWGLAWNRSLQAVQVGHGEAPPPPSAPPRPVFGVSATAALFRRAALEAVARGPAEVFDPRLGSYYEDADLAWRLRAAGWGALAVPAGRARHAGSTSFGPGRRPLVYGNRYLVAADLLGNALAGRLPAMVWRDLRDLGRALLTGRLAAALAVPRGWVRALARLGAHRRSGPPAVDPALLGLGLEPMVPEPMTPEPMASESIDREAAP